MCASLALTSCGTGSKEGINSDSEHSPSESPLPERKELQTAAATLDSESLDVVEDSLQTEDEDEEDDHSELSEVTDMASEHEDGSGDEIEMEEVGSDEEIESEEFDFTEVRDRCFLVNC